MKSLVGLISIFIALLWSSKMSAQGCSDAGFCSVNSIKPIEIQDSIIQLNSQFKVGLSYGLAQNNVSIFSPYIEYSRSFNRKTAVSFKVLSSIHVGELASTIGFSDAIATVNHGFTRKLKGIAGIKIPFNRSTLSKSGNDLPMAYQTSLGTFDFILGSSYSIKSFLLAIAYQQPLSQNQNRFLSEDYLAEDAESDYLSTNLYQRNGDILIRFSNFTTFKSNKIMFITSVLPIFHLANDHYTDKSGTEIEIEGSKGLTLNLNAYLQYKITSSNQVEFSLGVPVVSRESRPDGLSQFAIALEYVVNF